MPAVSVSQQHLMGQAHAVRKFLDTEGKEGLDPKTIDAEYRDQIVDLAKNMNPKDLEDFAKTKHKGLVKRVLKKENVSENSAMATVGSVNGMGAPSMPGDPGLQSDFGSQKVGSGDSPNPSTTRKKKKNQFKSFREFLDDRLSAKNLRSAF